MPTLERAIEIARKAHKGQVDKAGAPYIGHPLRVMERVPEEAKIAREVSPIYQTDKIIRPVFVVQGANDPRVNINESDQIVTALRAKGLYVPYMVKYNEGHGFYREENRMDFYGAMMGFLAKYLK